MSYAEVSPSPALRSVVSRYWAICAPFAEHRVLPDGCIDILVFGGLGARVVGAMTCAIVAPRASRPVVGVRFLPGEAARVVASAPRELTDGRAPLASAWGESALRLEDSVLAALEGPAATPLAILARVAPLLDAALLARLATHDTGADVRVRVAAALLAAGGSVEAAAARAELSPRQLSRRFTARVGVAPKLFGRVMRLQKAASLLATGATAAAASALAGYADQAHFSHDSKALTGLCPSALARELAGVGEARDAERARGVSL